jgi:hypothetical protein
MRENSTAPRVESRNLSPRYLIIVARDQAELWRYLTRDFAKFKGVEVLRDRRQGERRRATRTYQPGRDGGDRRRPSSVPNDLRCHGFVVVPRPAEGR